MHPSYLHPAPARRFGVVRPLVFTLLLGSTGLLLAQTQSGQTDDRRRRGGDDTNGRRGNFSPEDAQARMMSSIRERLDVTDDEEWKIISDRLGKVMELRRNSANGFGGFGGFAFGGRGPGGGDSSRGDSNRTDGNRGGSGRGTRTSSNTEMAALQSAIRDKLPDAEIKSRLERVRESRRDNEAKLSKAQEELRAVLSVRQEAVAVLFGFLP